MRDESSRRARERSCSAAGEEGREKRREPMTGTAKGKKSGKAAAIEVLRRSGKAMPVKEVVAAALADPQVTGLHGRTPAATLSAALYTEAKKPDGAVVLARRGMVKARPQPSPSARSA
jgi:HB1, ASXL, restriction endonuclease HTH domain